LPANKRGKTALKAVWWNTGHAKWPGDKFDLAVTAAINGYKDRRSVQLKVLDWRAGK
jgi:hypothetical protein